MIQVCLRSKFLYLDFYYEFFSFYGLVVFLENELLYGQHFSISDEALSADFVLPIGKGKIEREGKHISLVSHSIGLKICLDAAKELEQSGIQCEVSFQKFIEEKLVFKNDFLL